MNHLLLKKLKYIMKKKISSNALASVKISNISKNKNIKKKKKKNLYINRYFLR